MSFCEKGSTEVQEILVDTIMENSPLDEGNLSLSGTDFQTLTELSGELTLNEVENEAHEMVLDPQEVIEHEEEVETEEVINDDMEMDCETIHEEEMVTEVKAKPNILPPLRPLTIAPKPTKIPLAVKPVAGQQFLFVQGSNTAQTIKLLSPQGQELNVASLISRPVTLKPQTFKTVQSQGGNISIIQQKPLMVKKLLSPTPKPVQKPIATIPKAGQHFMVVQKATNEQQLKLVQSPTNIVNTTKTITLQQAQEMGLLTNTKLIAPSQSVPKQTLLLKNPSKTVRMVPQVTPTVVASPSTKSISLTTLKSPTKILPASTVGVAKTPQRIILKTSGSPTIIPSGQIIQVTGSQTLNSGQLHQINIPGKGMQYIKFVTASTPETSSTITPTAIKTSSMVTTTSNIVLSEVKPITVSKQLAPKPIACSSPKTNITSQMVVIPSLSSSLGSKVPIPASPLKTVPKVTKSIESYPVLLPPEETDANGMRPRKPCNCTKSQCLKLYCDCFANGEFCYMCKCMNCFNNLENEVHRTRAIKACLERNPQAFKPKIGKDKDLPGDLTVRKHTKGCNCKRSGCLKNYCECYEAKIACSNNCKCVGCCNVEDGTEKRTLKMISSVEKATNTPIMSVGQIIQTKECMLHPRRSSNSNLRKQTKYYITDDVIEATCQCLLTISDNADYEDVQDEETIKMKIIDEFGRCLTEIIDCTSNRDLTG